MKLVELLYLLFIALIATDSTSNRRLVVSGQFDENFMDCTRLNHVTNKWESYLRFNRTFTHLGYAQTPYYPYKYPKNTICIYNIRAPDGYKIQLKEFDSFNIEPSDECRHDYLEVREGKFGYSRLIGRFCNTHKPSMPMNLDTGSLWMKFYADDTIELERGFKLNFKFIKVKQSVSNNIGNSNYLGNEQLRPGAMTYMEKICAQYSYNLNSHLLSNYPSIVVTSQEIETYYSKKLHKLFGAGQLTERTILNSSSTTDDEFNLECTLTLQVEETKRVYLNLKRIEIDKNPKYDANCSKTYIEIYDGLSSVEYRRFQTCQSSQTSKIIRSDTNTLYLRFKLKEFLNSNNNSFSFIFNAFRSGKT